MSFHVAIVGGGITGLTAAFYLKRLAEEQQVDITYTLIESTERLGGKIQTEHRDGFVIERGPDSFLKRKKAATELVHDLGLQNDLVSNQTGQSYILKGGALHPIPEGSVMGVPTKLGPFFRSGLLTKKGKCRVLGDLFISRSKSDGDQSVGDFFRRRMGQEMVDHLISPLLSGIYAGNINKLSLQSTLPQFIETEKKHGSLIRGLTGPKKRSSQFFTLKSGLSSMVDGLKQALPKEAILLGKHVDEINKKGDQYELTLSDGQTQVADAVIMTIPHKKTAELLKEADYLHREEQVDDTSVATVSMAFPKENVQLGKEGTGFVVSRKEPVDITASTWTHQKWPNAAPREKALIRCYVGRSGDEEIIDSSDEGIVKTALKDLKKVVEITGEPDFYIVSRWRKAMPQYQVGHQAWLKGLLEKLPQDYPSVYLAGASYDGVGLPDCIRQGKHAATQIIQKLESMNQ